MLFGRKLNWCVACACSLFTHKRTHRPARDEKMELPSIPKKMSEFLGIISIKIHRIQNTFETITYPQRHNDQKWCIDDEMK